jgi:hypothetical protein
MARQYLGIGKVPQGIRQRRGYLQQTGEVSVKTEVFLIGEMLTRAQISKYAQAQHSVKMSGGSFSTRVTAQVFSLLPNPKRAGAMLYICASPRAWY